MQQAVINNQFLLLILNKINRGAKQHQDDKLNNLILHFKVFQKVKNLK
jgi:hypothetical protein